MIRITFLIAPGRADLTAHGHAEYDSTGRDIVCAAVSAVVQAYAGYLRTCPGVRISRLTLQHGRAEVFAVGGQELTLAARQCAVGLAQLAAAYPEHVNIN